MNSTWTSKLPFLLLALLVGVLAVGTVVDKAGTSGPLPPVVYGQWWFVTLWALLAVAAIFLICRRRLWKRPAVFNLHVSFLVILLGATVTHFTSRTGMIHLREGEVAYQYMSYGKEDGMLHMRIMPFLLVLDTFRVEYDADGITPADYVSRVTIRNHAEQRQATVSMNHIAREQGFRIFQTSYDEDFRGSLFTVSYDPWGTGVTYAGYFLLAISMIWLGVQRQRDVSPALRDTSTAQLGTSSARHGSSSARHRRASTVLMTILGVLLASYMVISIAFRPLLPVLRSPLLVVHVGVIMMSYVLLVVSMVRRDVLRYAVFLLAAGIFLGAVWANISWGSYWSWDPKETWAIITLLVYSVPFHQQSLPWFREEKHYRLYSLLCLLSLLMTYFGVNYLLGGMHSYAS